MKLQAIAAKAAPVVPAPVVVEVEALDDEATFAKVGAFWTIQFTHQTETYESGSIVVCRKADGTKTLRKILVKEINPDTGADENGFPCVRTASLDKGGNIVSYTFDASYRGALA